MESTQVMEPTFRVIGATSRPQATLFSPARAASLAQKGFFGLLEHIGICHAPRVLGAQCLAGDSCGTATETGMGE